MTRNRLTQATVGVFLAALAVALPARADWLVTKSGDRVETDGPWQVKSRLVVFERPDGSYASMRLSAVDLDESRRVTKAAAEEAERARTSPRPQATETRREPIARLTDKDLPPVGKSAQAETQEPAKAAAKDQERRQQSPSGLMVSNWHEDTHTDAPGLLFVGQVRNPTENMAVGVTLTVKLYDQENKPIESTQAVLTSNALPSGGSGGFRASFPGVYYYARADFDIEGTMLETNEGGDQAAPETAGESGESGGR